MRFEHPIFFLGIVSGCLLTILLVILIVLLIVCLRIRCKQRNSRRRYLYGPSIDLHEHEKEPYHDTLNKKTYQKVKPMEAIAVEPAALSPIPLRSYVNYLQLCYYNEFRDQCSSYDIPKMNFKPELIDQFQFLIDNNEHFIESLGKILFKFHNKKILNNLILTQRYHLKKLLQFNNDWIYFDVCILTAYDGFLSNQMTSLLFQLYHQLKFKIRSGPIDVVEPTSSYYSLNSESILHDQSILFSTVQLIVHIEFSVSDDLLLINVACLTCDTISQVKEKILDQISLYKAIPRVSVDECQLYLLTNIKSSPNSCSTSSCSSSTTSSSNIPLAKKSLLTQFFSHRTKKYSTTTTTTSTLNDSYRDSIVLLLNDVDNTNERMSHCKKLNTLQHYGILSDGYEFKIILPKPSQTLNYTDRSNLSPQTSMFPNLAAGEQTF